MKKHLATQTNSSWLCLAPGRALIGTARRWPAAISSFVAPAVPTSPSSCLFRSFRYCWMSHVGLCRIHSGPATHQHVEARKDILGEVQHGGCFWHGSPVGGPEGIEEVRMPRRWLSQTGLSDDSATGHLGLGIVGSFQHSRIESMHHEIIWTC